ncbi:hypothetical protein HMPREF3190_00179 [Umbribacter vaginalis]|nr:hypothetical protein HMPREF3190_00179 [Coriobacteriales bacterium DNF00809]
MPPIFYNLIITLACYKVQRLSMRITKGTPHIKRKHAPHSWQ